MAKPDDLNEDGMLWQLFKAYANEDWDHKGEPWPAPAEAFLQDASAAEAAALARELQAIGALGLNDAGWRRLLEAAEVDADSLAPDGDLTGWAADLENRAKAAAG